MTSGIDFQLTGQMAVASGTLPDGGAGKEDRVEAVALPLLEDLRSLEARSTADLERFVCLTKQVRASSLLREGVEDAMALSAAFRIEEGALYGALDAIAFTLQSLPATSYRSRVARLEKLIKDFMSHGHLFYGAPLILSVGTHADGSLDLKLVWTNDIRSYIPLEGIPFLACDASVISKLEAVRACPPSSIEQLRPLFAYIKRITPHENSMDGCNPRCLWVACLLQEIFQLDCDKIKVWSKDGKIKLDADPSLFPADVHWVMHTAPVVKIRGQEYVLDLCLEEPVPLELWLSKLCRPDQVIISREKRWDMPCLSAPGQKAPRDDFLSLRDDLRAFYLFENIDGNDPSDGKKWEDWTCAERGCAPIETMDAYAPKLLEVVIHVERDAGGAIILRKRTIPYDEARFASFRMEGGIYYRAGVYEKLQAMA